MPRSQKGSWRGKGKRRHHGGGRGGDGKRVKRDGGDRIDWDKMEFRNANFEMYYKALGIVPEAEWQPFMDTLGRVLPSTFRINELALGNEQIQRELDGFMDRRINREDGTKEEVVQRVSWFPGTAVKMPFDRRTLRKDPTLKDLHTWMVANAESGNITRQEFVSMVPPLLLDVSSEHAVVDLCAAPGSKTSQMLERLHAAAPDVDSRRRPQGFVIANDVNADRAFMLVHQCKRLLSGNFAATCYAAQYFPLLRGCGGFDRVLADVPCSGDGTMRKNPDIWKKWKTMSSVQLHPLQIDIAVRGASLLKPGGRLVYSTCSLNPIEDEACVAELLRRTDGALRLVDCSDQLQSLRRRAGVSSWPVLFDKRQRFEQPTEEEVAAADGDAVRVAVAKGFRHYERYEDLEEGTMAHNKLTKSMFPPTAEEAAAMNLARCMRFLPQDADTGGFFVAVLEKVSEFPVVSEANARRNEASAAEVPAEMPKKEKGSGKLQLYFAPGAEVKAELREYFGLDEAFPLGNLVTVSESCRSINIVPDKLRDTIFGGRGGGSVRTVWLGIKAFDKIERTRCPFPFRLSQEGLPLVLPHMSKRVLKTSKLDFARLARGGMIDTRDGAAGFSQGFLDAFFAHTVGCVVALFDADGDDDASRAPPITSRDVLALVCWRGAGQVVNVLAPKEHITTLRTTLRQLQLMPEQEDAAERDAAAKGLPFLHLQVNRRQEREERKANSGATVVRPGAAFSGDAAAAGGEGEAKKEGGAKDEGGKKEAAA